MKTFASCLCFRIPQGRLLWQWRLSTKMTPKRQMGCCVTRSCLRTLKVQPPICSPSTIKQGASSQWQRAWTERCAHIYYLFFFLVPFSHCYVFANTLNVKKEKLYFGIQGRLFRSKAFCDAKLFGLVLASCRCETPCLFSIFISMDRALYFKLDDKTQLECICSYPDCLKINEPTLIFLIAN